MTRIAGIVAALGLVAFGRAQAAEEKSETKVEHQSDAKGDSTKVEKSDKSGSATSDEKRTVEHKVRSDGKVETKKHVKTSKKPSAHAKKSKAEVKEKTVKDPQGNVIEHEKSETAK